MKRLWTTAAAAALCVFAADAWAAPHGGRLELVAVHHHRAARKTERHHASSRRRKAPPSEIHTESGRTVTVDRHDTLSSISRDTGVSTTELIRLNHLRRPYVLRRGQHLKLPPRRYYVVKRGDNITQLAQKFGVDAAQLLDLNSISHGRELRAGQKLYLGAEAHEAHEAAAPDEEDTGARERRAERSRASEIHTESGRAVTVGRHDTLESISRETGVATSELARLNHLRRPYRVRRGEHLKLPERRYYLVRPGDTLYSVARKFGLDVGELQDLNGISRGRELRSGQKLYLPGAAQEAAPPEEEAPRPSVRRAEPSYTPPSYTPPRYTPPRVEQTLPPPAARPYAQPGPTYAPPAPTPAAPLNGAGTTSAPPQPAPAATPGASNQGFQLTPPARQAPVTPNPTPARPLIQTNPAPTASDVATAGRGKFIWPVNGAVIQGFGPKADGQRNDGLNISGTAGDPVRAAADGEVVYAGDQVPSFGNLVLIKHQGGWVTAYAHMARILVHNRDQVVQGQEIGVVGQTGSVDRPQLHFEIRYAPSPRDKALPVDPTLVLPQK